MVVALKRTWDIPLNSSAAPGKFGVMWLMFMTIHLFQFRFGEIQQSKAVQSLSVLTSGGVRTDLPAWQIMSCAVLWNVRSLRL